MERSGLCYMLDSLMPMLTVSVEQF